MSHDLERLDLRTIDEFKALMSTNAPECMRDSEDWMNFYDYVLARDPMAFNTAADLEPRADDAEELVLHARRMALAERASMTPAAKKAPKALVRPVAKAKRRPSTPVGQGPDDDLRKRRVAAEELAERVKEMDIGISNQVLELGVSTLVSDYIEPDRCKKMAAIITSLEAWLTERELFLASISAPTLLEFCLSHSARTVPGSKAAIIKLLGRTFRLPWDLNFKTPSSGGAGGVLGESLNYVGVTEPESLIRLSNAGADLVERNDARAAAVLMALYAATANQRFRHCQRGVFLGISETSVHTEVFRVKRSEGASRKKQVFVTPTTVPWDSDDDVITRFFELWCKTRESFPGLQTLAFNHLTGQPIARHTWMRYISSVVREYQVQDRGISILGLRRVQPTILQVRGISCDSLEGYALGDWACPPELGRGR